MRFFITLPVLACASLLTACQSMQATEEPSTPPRVAPFLLFQDGRAEEAMRFYASTFPDAEVLFVDRYAPGEAGEAGKVKRAAVSVMGQRIDCTDSPPVHEFGFTPAVSFFLECGSVEEVNHLKAELSEDGAVMMPPGDYGFSEWFSWVQDRFGISWQLNYQGDRAGS